MKKAENAPDIAEQDIELKVVKQTAAQFSKEVDDLVWMEDISYMEALTEIIEKYGYEVSPKLMKGLLTPELKAELQREAEKLNRIPKEAFNLEEI